MPHNGWLSGFGGWTGWWRLCLAVGLGCAIPAVAVSNPLDPQTLPGIVVDDPAAELTGTFKKSTQIRPFVGENYLATEPGEASATFSLAVPSAGEYRVLMSYSANGNRAKRVPVRITAGADMHLVTVDQTQTPAAGGPFHLLTTLKLTGPTLVVVHVAAGPSGATIVDAVAVLTEPQWTALKSLAGLKTPAVAKPAAQKSAAPPAVPVVALPPFARRPGRLPVARISASELDAKIAGHLPGLKDSPVVNDEIYLRRVTLDLLGRPPTLDEQVAFRNDATVDKRVRVVDRLLSLPDFGSNWANYWSDVIGSRQQEPELTFHDYKPLKRWLAEKIHAGQGWDATVYVLLTAQGQVKHNPAATYIGFHQGEPNRLAGETARVFLGVQIACAQCHDHPFVTLPQQKFHALAAFFARTQAKVAQLDSDLIEVLSKPTGEWKMPPAVGASKKDKASGDMPPAVLTGEKWELGLSDAERRDHLARWIVSADNPYFARATVNRLWTRTLGRPFTTRVDDIGADSAPLWDNVWQSLAEHFVATDYSHRELLRVIVTSKAYQRPIAGPETSDRPFAAAQAVKLRGDEVFDSLVVALDLPNVTPERAKKTAAVRFPPPPKSTRDLVNVAFGYDPSLADGDIPRTLPQAMFLMNNRQVRAQIDGRPESGTVLAKLLTVEADNAVVVTRLWERVLARRPTAIEHAEAVAYLQSATDRISAAEDLLWSLLNTAEFVTRR